MEEPAIHAYAHVTVVRWYPRRGVRACVPNDSEGSPRCVTNRESLCRRFLRAEECHRVARVARSGKQTNSALTMTFEGHRLLVTRRTTVRGCGKRGSTCQTAALSWTVSVALNHPIRSTEALAGPRAMRGTCVGANIKWGRRGKDRGMRETNTNS